MNTCFRTRRIALLCAALCCSSATLLFGLRVANGHESEHSAQPFTEKEQHRPKPLPDRVVLTWSGDPTKSIDVTWRTDTTTGVPAAEFAQADSLVGNLREGAVPHSNRRGWIQS